MLRHVVISEILRSEKVCTVASHGRTAALPARLLVDRIQGPLCAGRRGVKMCSQPLLPESTRPGQSRLLTYGFIPSPRTSPAPPRTRCCSRRCCGPSSEQTAQELHVCKSSPPTALRSPRAGMLIARPFLPGRGPGICVSQALREPPGQEDF